MQHIMLETNKPHTMSSMYKSNIRNALDVQKTTNNIEFTCLLVDCACTYGIRTTDGNISTSYIRPRLHHTSYDGYT